MLSLDWFLHHLQKPGSISGTRLVSELGNHLGSTLCMTVTSNMNRYCCCTSEGGRGALPANMGPGHNTAEVSVVPRLMAVQGHQAPGVEVRLSVGLDGV